MTALEELILLQGEPQNCFGAASPCACPVLEGSPGRASSRDRTGAALLCHRGQHLAMPHHRERGWNPQELCLGACSKARNSCCLLSLPAPAQGHPAQLQPLSPRAEPAPRTPCPPHFHVPAITQRFCLLRQVGDLLSTLFHFHFELDYCLLHISSPEYLRSI